MSDTRFINPDALQKPPGYTHVVEATAPARLVYIAGQLGVDREGKISSDFRLQAVQTFENLKAALEAVGGRFKHVVKLNNYLVDVKYLPIFRQVRDSYLSDKDRPASTTIAISGLAREGGLLEIEAVAVLPPAIRAKATSERRSGRARQSRLRDENESDQHQDWQQHHRRPCHVAEEARHLHAALERDGINHEIWRIADIGQRAHIDRSHGNRRERSPRAAAISSSASPPASSKNTR